MRRKCIVDGRRCQSVRWRLAIWDAENGPERVRDCPISEAADLRSSSWCSHDRTSPTVDMDLLAPVIAMDANVNQAAKTRYVCGKGQSQ